jgi:hypothetical protein
MLGDGGGVLLPCGTCPSVLIQDSLSESAQSVRSIFENDNSYFKSLHRSFADGSRLLQTSFFELDSFSPFSEVLQTAISASSQPLPDPAKPRIAGQSHVPTSDPSGSRSIARAQHFEDRSFAEQT